jgi:hypothetical protein
MHSRAQPAKHARCEADGEISDIHLAHDTPQRARLQASVLTGVKVAGELIVDFISIRATQAE